MRDHGAALDHDLMTRTRFTLDDVPAVMGWTTLAHFVAYLKPGSALHDELHPNLASYDFKAGILADIFDLLATFRHVYVSANSKAHKPRPKPYPRPWLEKQVRHYGKDPIPMSQFDAWWDSR